MQNSFKIHAKSYKIRQNQMKKCTKIIPKLFKIMQKHKENEIYKSKFNICRACESRKEELKNRLLKRDQNTEEEVEKRYKSFDEDVKHWNDYDYVIINKNLETCFTQIQSIILNYKSKPFNSFHRAQ